MSVENLAYALWEARGRPVGDDWADWFAAEARLEADRAKTETRKMTQREVKRLLGISDVAVMKFLGRCIVPIISDHEGRHGVYGCGVLYAVGARRFLVTANHVLKAVPGGQLAIPVSIGRTSEIWTIAARRAATSDPSATDVAVIELDHPQTLERLERGGRTFLRDENVFRGAPPEVFVVFGYPAANAKESGDEFLGEPLLISARRYTGPLDAVSNVKPGPHDLLLEWTRDVSLLGISGAPIWAVREAAPGEVWMPEKSLQLLAVETGVAPEVWIRGTFWNVVEAQAKKLIDARK